MKPIEKIMKPFVANIVHLLAREEFGQVLQLLRTQKTQGGLIDIEKRVLIHVFDKFLEDLENQGTIYMDVDIEILAEIKKVLIVYQLETSGYNRSRLKDVIKATVLASKPLGDLVRKPFAFCIKFMGIENLIQIPSDYALEIYREVLESSDKHSAKELHKMQRLYYHGLPSAEAYKRYTLEDFMDVQV